MNFLYVDSCQDKLFIMVYNSGNYVTKSSDGNRKHNSVLLPLVDEALAECGIAIADIEHIACVVGPGSFTGIRLGVTTCNGLAFATGAKRIAINTFEAAAYNNTNHILVALDCRHGNYYVGEYDDGQQIALGNMDKAQLDEFDGEVIECVGARDDEKIIGVVLDKIKKQQFADMLSPLYLKKSQAEREAE